MRTNPIAHAGAFLALLIASCGKQETPIREEAFNQHVRKGLAINAENQKRTFEASQKRWQEGIATNAENQRRAFKASQESRQRGIELRQEEERRKARSF